MFPARKFARRINRLAIAVLLTPPPDGVEVLQTEPDRVKDLMAISADGIRAVQLGTLTDSQVRDCRLVLLVQRRNVGRGGGHMVPEKLFQHPHATFDRAGAIGERSCCKDACHSQNSPAIAITHLDTPHLGPSDGFFQAVNRSQSSIEIGVIGIDETDHALVFAHDVLEKQANFIVHRLAHPSGHLREHRRIEDLALQTADAQPLRAETVKKRARATILQQTPYLRIQNRRLMERSLVCQRHQILVRHGGP